MPFCPSCGTSADGKFCPKCGTAIGVAPGGGASYNAPPQGMGYAPPPPPPPGYNPPPPGYQQGYQAPPPPQPINAPGLPSNIASLLCYVIPVIGPIIFLVVEPYKSDRKVRFDAFQSIFLWVSFIVLQIVLSILVGISYHLYFTHNLLRLVELGITILMAIKAFQGEKLVLPIIGPIAEKQA
jgi:uncharacterized membrane protein